jgi:Carboxypeptidase regulatory-like domain
MNRAFFALLLAVSLARFPAAAQLPPSALATVSGRVLSAFNHAVPDAPVRLRDPQNGRVVDTQITDKSGSFAFRPIDGGTYIIEVLGENHSVLATSPLLAVDPGTTLSVIIKLPADKPLLALIMGHSTATAILVASAAASAGVLIKTATGQDASPTRPR